MRFIAPSLPVAVIAGMAFGVFSAAFGADPAHVAPNLAAELNSITSGAQVRLVWVQKQLISDDTSRFLDCGVGYLNYLYNGGLGTKLVGFDSREGTGRILDSTHSKHIKPIIDRSGRYVLWNDMDSSKSWIMSWDGRVKKPLIQGGEYIVMCTGYERVSGKEYIYAAGFQKYDEHLLTVRNIYRYTFDPGTASVNTATRTLMWNKSSVMAPFNVDADGKNAGGNMPWPDAQVAALPNGSLTRVNAAGQWSCHANIAPDASGRFFHMEESHRQIAMYGPSHANPVWIPIMTKLPGMDPNWNCNAPRWTNHVAFLSAFAPAGYWGSEGTRDCAKPVMTAAWKTGETGEMFFGKFNDQFNDAQFIRVTDGDWRFRKIQGDAWVSTGEGPVAVSTVLPSAPARRSRVDKHGNIEIMATRAGPWAATICTADGHRIREAWTTGECISIQVATLTPGVYAVSIAGQGILTRQMIVVR